MEDYSAELALTLPAAVEDLTARLGVVSKAAADIAVLMSAAEVLNRRGHCSAS